MNKILFLLLALFISARTFSQTIILDLYDSSGVNPSGTPATDGTFLYCTTMDAGANYRGTIFKIKPDGTNYSKLLDFEEVSNGSRCAGPLLIEGLYLYGMTRYGGTHDYGTIFKIKKDGTGFMKLLDFSGAADGANPNGSLITDGVFLYGVATGGGSYGYGVIFKIKTDGTGYIKLHDFGAPNDGYAPTADLTSDGTFLYGVTRAGGVNNGGTIFRIRMDGSDYEKIHDFPNVPGGAAPVGSLTLDDGYLYGMGSGGGTYNIGTIFKIDTNGAGFSTLLNFVGVATGSSPTGSLLKNGSYFYGLTPFGGIYNSGVMFKIKPDGTGYVKMNDFTGTAAMPSTPPGSLIADGNYLYGMTQLGGLHYDGTLFKTHYCTPPTISSEDTIMCYWYGTIALNSGIPAGGTYSGPAITGNYFDPNIVGIGIYDVIYTYIDTSGCGNYDTSQITVLPCLNTENADWSELIVYPNPTDDFINISASFEGLQMISLTDMSGKEVFMKEVYFINGSSITMDLTIYPPGIYLLKVGQNHQKLIRH